MSRSDEARHTAFMEWVAAKPETPNMLDYVAGFDAGVVEGIRQAREAGQDVHLIRGSSINGGEFTIRIADWDAFWDSLGNRD